MFDETDQLLQVERSNIVDVIEEAMAPIREIGQAVGQAIAERNRSSISACIEQLSATKQKRTEQEALGLEILRNPGHLRDILRKLND
jgi:hypothetical protein